jgi:hypothetical protein
MLHLAWHPGEDWAGFSASDAFEGFQASVSDRLGECLVVLLV